MANQPAVAIASIGARAMLVPRRDLDRVGCDADRREGAGGEQFGLPTGSVFHIVGRPERCRTPALPCRPCRTRVFRFGDDPRVFLSVDVGRDGDRMRVLAAGAAV